MILDALDNAEKYAALHNRFSEAFDFLNRADLTDLPEGKHEISGDQIFAIIAHEKGRSVSDAQMEGHRNYIDIQYVISGNESMGWSPRNQLVNSVVYDHEKDLEFFEGVPNSIVSVPSGSFAAFFPSDAHLPLIGEGPIHKVVVKVKMIDR